MSRTNRLLLALLAFVSCLSGDQARAQFSLLNSLDADPAFQLSIPSGINSAGAGTDGLFPFLALDTDGKTDRIADVATDDRDAAVDLIAFLLAQAIGFTTDDPFAQVEAEVWLILLLNAAEAGTLDLSELSQPLVTGLGNSDPYLARTIRVTNNHDVPFLFRIETALETVVLDGATSVGEARFQAEVFDTGGDPGAELEFSLGHTLRDIDSGLEFVTPLSFEDTITDGQIASFETTGDRFGFLEDFDRILQSAFLTISPGDTAVVSMIGNFGDATFPLADINQISADLAAIDATVEAALAIPEPGTLLLSLLGVTGVTQRRRHLR